jgi:iron-sulfur cluster assembly accessory protein
MLTICAAAIPHLEALIESSQEGKAEGEGSLGFRVFVEKGGCAGLQYGMKVDALQPGDSISEGGRARVFVDAQSVAYLKGAELDYCDDLTGTGFVIRNPNASRSCGCGTSFEPAIDSSPATAADSGRSSEAPQVASTGSAFPV